MIQLLNYIRAWNKEIQFGWLEKNLKIEEKKKMKKNKIIHCKNDRCILLKEYSSKINIWL